MLRRRLIHWSRLMAAPFFVFTGCVSDLDLQPPPPLPGEPGSVVEAQFDPTNPIPVLTRIPTPTVFAQNADGTLNQSAVAPADCERPTTSQCLAFVEGWPTSTPITLFFSDQIDLNSVGDGIELYEVSSAGVMTRVPLNTGATVQIPRPAPGPDLMADPSRNPNACADEFRYTDAALIGYDVIVFPETDEIPSTPTPDLKLSTQYIVLVKSDTQGGLRDTTGNPIQPSGLFFLLNDDTQPVQEDGTITSGLLRGQVQGSVLAAAFGGRLAEDLSAEELAVLDQQVTALGLDLFPLYTAFETIVNVSRQNMVLTDRRQLAYANTWTTGGPPRPTVVFDPENSRIPFPNSELLLSNQNAFGDFRVALPESGPIPAQLARGLNKLDGFSIRTPGIRVPGVISTPDTGPVIQFETDVPVDQATLADAIVMFKLDDQGAPDGSIQLIVTSTGTDVSIMPVLPLESATTYVVGVTRSLKHSGGDDFAPSATFELLKTPAPLIDSGTVLPDVAPALQCIPLTQGGSNLSDPQTVAATATALEPLRARWQPTFAALEAADVPRTNLLSAWSYTTQSITNDVDGVKARLFSGDFDPATGPLIAPTGISATGPAEVAALTGIIEQICLPLCLAGNFGVDPAMCTDEDGNPTAAVTENPLCTMLFDQLGSAELLSLTTHGVTSGNPFVDGTFDAGRLQNPVDGSILAWLVKPLGAEPEGGYPVVMFQHGLNQQKEDTFAIANSFAAAGWATIAVDLPYHGSRASDITTELQTPGLGAVEVPCPTPVDPDAVMCDPMTGMCVGGCDGVQDASGTGFLSANIPANRDNVRQGIIDLLTLVHTIQQEAGAALPQLNPNRISFIGQSFGGITGANLVAYLDNNELETAVLNVAGGNSVELTLNSIVSVAFNAQLNALGICFYNVFGDPSSGCQLTPDYLSFLSLADWAFQPADPVMTASAAVSRFGADNILMQVSVPDPVVTSSSSEALGRSYGFSVSGDDPQYQTYDCSASPPPGGGHGFLLIPVCGACPLEALCNTVGVQTQSVTYIASDGQVITPQTPADVAGQSCVNPCVLNEE